MNKILLVEDIKVGADPEMFLWSEVKNKFVPVCGLVGGTKDAPLLITNNGHALQEDNVAVEFCIPPCETAEDFIKHINFVKNYINDTILKPIDLVTKCVASARFTFEELDNYQAQTFGCDPDYNAWTGLQNEVDKSDSLLRTAAAHIHVGYKNCTADVSLEIVQAMDLFIGLPSVLLDPDVERRKMYGKAGSYRFKSYGVEYRVPGNFWLETDDLIKWAFNATIEATKFVNSGGIITNSSDIIKAINECNKDLALEILDEYNIEVSVLEKTK